MAKEDVLVLLVEKILLQQLDILWLSGAISDQFDKTAEHEFKVVLLLCCISESKIHKLAEASLQIVVVRLQDLV